MNNLKFLIYGVFCTVFFCCALIGFYYDWVFAIGSFLSAYGLCYLVPTKYSKNKLRASFVVMLFFVTALGTSEVVSWYVENQMNIHLVRRELDRKILIVLFGGFIAAGTTIAACKYQLYK